MSHVVMTMDASESDEKKSSRGLPFSPSLDSASPSTVEKLTRPMMLRARACSGLMSQVSLGGTAEKGGRGVGGKSYLA